MTGSAGLLVGVDWSQESLRAVEWAAAEAASGGSRLTICHVLQHQPVDVPLPDHVLHQIVDEGQSLLDRAVARARAVSPALAVDARLDCGRAAEALLDLARAAEQVVLGAHRVAGFYRPRLASVPAQVVAHAVCPVTIVRGQPGPTGVLIGVCGPDDRAALDMGFDYAARHGLPVQPVHAYTLPMPLPRMGTPTVPVERIREAALRILTEAVGPWTVKYPDVAVEPIVAPGHPAGVLADASHGAALLVVGTRGRGALTGALLGSTSRGLLRHAHCPLTIAR